VEAAKEGASTRALAMETVIHEADITRRFLQQERAVGRVDDGEYQRAYLPCAAKQTLRSGGSRKSTRA